MVSKYATINNSRQLTKEKSITMLNDYSTWMAFRRPFYDIRLSIVDAVKGL